MYDGLKPPTKSKRGPFFERAALAFVFLAGCAIISLVTAWLLETFEDFNFLGEAPASELAVLNSETPTTIPSAIATETSTVRPIATATRPALDEGGQSVTGSENAGSIATRTPTTANTQVSAPTHTPKELAYALEIDQIVEALHPIVAINFKLNDELVNNLELLSDDEWVLEMRNLLADFDSQANRILSIEHVPIKFQAMHSALASFAAETQLMVENYTLAIDQSDISYLYLVIENLDIMDLHINQFAEEREIFLSNR